jgi:large subunit ribosomal protein L11
MMSKKVLATISLVINAGGAKASPPVGPALGSHGLNIMAFCKDFNARTADIKQTVPIPVRITAFTDKSYAWDYSTPPTSYLLLQATGRTSGSSKPNHVKGGYISLKHIYEIAKVKGQRKELQFIPAKSICLSVLGSAKSLGIQLFDTQ